MIRHNGNNINTYGTVVSIKSIRDRFGINVLWKIKMANINVDDAFIKLYSMWNQYMYTRISQEDSETDENDYDNDNNEKNDDDDEDNNNQETKKH